MRPILDAGSVLAVSCAMSSQRTEEGRRDEQHNNNIQGEETRITCSGETASLSEAVKPERDNAVGETSPQLLSQKAGDHNDPDALGRRVRRERRKKGKKKRNTEESGEEEEVFGGGDVEVRRGRMGGRPGQASANQRPASPSSRVSGVLLVSGPQTALLEGGCSSPPQGIPPRA